MPQLDMWTADNAAVWRERLGDQTIALRHPTYPAEKVWTDGNNDTFQAFVAKYLAKVEGILGLSDLFSANGDFAVPLVWLPLLDNTDEGADPRASFWVTRHDDSLAPSHLLDRTVVFLAVEALRPNQVDTVLGSRRGIRIVAHVSRLENSTDMLVRITGAARSVDLPHALGARVQTIEAFFDFFFAPDRFNALKSAIRTLGGLSDDTPLAMNGVRVHRAPKDRVFVELHASIPRPYNDPDSPAYALTANLDFDPIDPLASMTVERFPLVANVLPVTPTMFTQDLASKAGPGHLVDARPNRSPERLAGFRDVVTLDGIERDTAGLTHLHDNLDLVKVTKSKLVDGTVDETREEVVQLLRVKHAQMNAFAALSGYERARAAFDEHHARPLFETIIRFGLSPFLYFRLAAPPLLVRYRARIRPGPGKDGRTVNAQVDFEPPECDLVGPTAEWDSAARKPLQVRFALADLKRSASRREPLGLAADPRWSWHEYCHVLLAGRTGALEFHFAHSAGDALAAIISDPWSELVRDQSLRGATYPWVYLHRRHDRSVYDGWSWSGRYHRPGRFGASDCNCRHKGYQSEQILSSSLFRLYRALGGDTLDSEGAPDRPARQRAADYAVYLILRAIGLLPPAYLNVVETPDQFVSVLIYADIGTWPASTGPLQGRAGGWAHKVVRWAFEAQGLYACTNPWEVVDAPGKPPPVDIFIDTRRPDAQGHRPRGGYVPVSLDWHAASGPSSWHASDSAIQISGNQVTVEVRNRGDLPASGVRVEVWWADWTPASPPKWNEAGKWTSLGSSPPQTVPAWPPNPPATFGPFTLPSRPAGTELLILAKACCAADPANIDLATSLPCAIAQTPIIDLVSGDNNLGLRLHVVP